MFGVTNSVQVCAETYGLVGGDDAREYGAEEEDDIRNEEQHNARKMDDRLCNSVQLWFKDSPDPVVRNVPIPDRAIGNLRQHLANFSASDLSPSDGRT